MRCSSAGRTTNKVSTTVSHYSFWESKFGKYCPQLLYNCLLGVQKSSSGHPPVLGTFFLAQGLHNLNAALWVQWGNRLCCLHSPHPRTVTLISFEIPGHHEPDSSFWRFLGVLHAIALTQTLVLLDHGERVLSFS